MSTRGSVTVWIHGLKAGDDRAAEHLWAIYFKKLVSLARHKLPRHLVLPADEEDAALSAFKSFFRGVEKRRFPRLEDRDDLWQLLVMLTDRKACRMRKRELRAKRGGGKVRSLSASETGERGIGAIISRAPTAEFAAQIAEEIRLRMNELDDDGLRSVATAKFEGYSNSEIAERLGVVERTVERRLSVIRNLWTEAKIEP
jgi:DNA-directed RNA polymerase specialized sigma24 family protein